MGNGGCDPPLPIEHGAGGLFVVSTADDGTVKVWTCDRSNFVSNMRKGKNAVVIKDSVASAQAHKKDINALDINPKERSKL